MLIKLYLYPHEKHLEQCRIHKKTSNSINNSSGINGNNYIHHNSIMNIIIIKSLIFFFLDLGSKFYLCKELTLVHLGLHFCKIRIIILSSNCL